MSTPQIITLIISVAGFILSAINAVYAYINRHRNIKVTMRNYTVATHYNNLQLINVYLRIENFSQLSISITRVRLVIDNSKFDVSIFPETVFTKVHTSGAEVTSREKLSSTTLPINILPLGGFAGFLSFPVPVNSLSKDQKQLTFEISTNRGNAFQKTLEPDEAPLLY